MIDMNDEIRRVNEEQEADNKKIEEVYSKIFGACFKLNEQIEKIRVFTQEQSQITTHAQNKKSLFKIQMLLIDLQMKSQLVAGKVDEHLKNPKNYKPLYMETPDVNENQQSQEEEKEDPTQENIV
jgi:DNA polymerase sigma